jgi:ferritin-like metal-binding protein YciE
MRDLYSAETQLEEALPKMAEAASHDELREAFEEHLQETRDQVKRLRHIFDTLNETPEGEHCDAMAGLIEEGEQQIQEEGEAHVKDAALIAAAQRVEHYEIAGYGSARNYAHQLQESEVADLLDETLAEEKSADKKLNKLATGGWISSGINEEAREEAAP